MGWARLKSRLAGLGLEIMLLKLAVLKNEEAGIDESHAHRSDVR